MLKVSVIIVSYNTRELLRACLLSLVGANEVIVVDNASADGSANMVEQSYPAVKLIRSDRNLGFGAANNRGLDVATGELILFLNSDARAKPGSILTLTEVFEDGSFYSIFINSYDSFYFFKF